MSAGSRTVASEREIELALAGPPNLIASLPAHPVVARHALAPARRERMVSRYFDTPALDLWRRRAVLRIRSSDGRFELTLKQSLPGTTGLAHRREWNLAADAFLPDLRRLPRELRDGFGLGPATRLVPVFETDIWRVSVPLRLERPCGGSCLIELACDLGEIRAGGRSEAVCEVELELREGELDLLRAFASRLQGIGPLRPQAEDKALRGYRLRFGDAAFATAAGDLSTMR